MVKHEQFKEAETLALSMVRGSIIEKATVRFLTQAIEELAAMKAEQIAPLKAEIDRLSTIKATIVVNTMRAGYSREEAEAVADGTSDKTFYDVMAEHFAKASPTTESN